MPKKWQHITFLNASHLPSLVWVGSKRVRVSKINFVFFLGGLVASGTPTSNPKGYLEVRSISRFQGNDNFSFYNWEKVTFWWTILDVIISKRFINADDQNLGK